jgi:hypothetical protein
MEREARGKADALERDAQEKHRVAMGTLEQARASLERKVEDLRAFEREYRQRLKSYLESQMRQLESNSTNDDPMLSSRGAGSSPFPQLGPGSSAPAPAPAMAGVGMGPGMAPAGMPQGMPPGMAPGMAPGMGMGPGGMGPGMAPVNPPPMPAPAMAGSAMSQMTQTMAPIRPGVPPQSVPNYPPPPPSPMRGFLIEEDPDS